MTHCSALYLPGGSTCTAWRAAVAGLCLAAGVGTVQAQTSLNSLLKAETQQAGFPALAAAVVSRGKLVTPIISISANSSAATTVAGGVEYAFGWATRYMPWTSYPLAFHGGSIDMNKAFIWLDTLRDAAIVIMSSVAAPNSDEVMLQLGSKLYRRFIASAKQATCTHGPLTKGN